MVVVKKILDATGKRKVEIIRRDDGSFGFSAPEFVDNNWGSASSSSSGTESAAVAAGTYRVRLQFENMSFSQDMFLEWITPDQGGEFDEIANGPNVIDGIGSAEGLSAISDETLWATIAPAAESVYRYDLSEHAQTQCLCPGIARGPLVGGNLADARTHEHGRFLW